MHRNVAQPGSALPWGGRKVGYVVYILKSLKDNKHYIGHTEDVEKRLAAHNSGKVKSTRNRKPMKLIYVEEQASRSAAFCREKYLKSIEGLKEKKRIIEEFDRRV